MPADEASRRIFVSEALATSDALRDIIRRAERMAEQHHPAAVSSGATLAALIRNAPAVCAALELLASSLKSN